ncbi:MAG: hypothetical protein WC793_00075 [Candidatus Paceibacterota bacterium]|jgi:hypothetical protein
MKRLIHNIRKQPEEIRRHILNVLILIFAIILFLLWIYSLGATLNDTDTQIKMNQDLKPFSALKDNIVGGFNSIKDPNSEIIQQ